MLLKGLFLGSALVLLSAAPAAAQTNVSGGYAMVNWAGCCAHGFMVDIAHQIHASGSMAASVVGDFGWTRFGEPDNENDTTFAGGLRVTFFRENRLSAFQQVTVGGVHWDQKPSDGFPPATGNDFMIGVGAGAIYKVNSKVGLKPQVDLFFLPSNDFASDWFVRFSISAVIPIGK